ncbi:unnamed protein product, partial [Meganyctiphanes norvegica]
VPKGQLLLWAFIITLMTFKQSWGFQQDEDLGDEDQIDVSKRVFLSRGWGPGGYETYVARPSRFPRRPQGPPTTSRPSVATGRNLDGAKYAALVWLGQQKPRHPKPQNRRFHSIFTSGTWSPLGKRSGENNNWDDSEDTWLDNGSNISGDDWQNTESIVIPFIANMKRSNVFTSRGWGAGGTAKGNLISKPKQHPWSSVGLGTSVRNNDLNIHNMPEYRPNHRYVSRFHSDDYDDSTPPLFNLFVSHGWGPMGR